MSRSGKVLVLDDQRDRGRQLASILTEAGYQVDIHTNLHSSQFSLANSAAYDVVIADEADLCGANSELNIKQHTPDMDMHVPSIMLASKVDADSVATALRLGAIDFFVRPLRDAEALFAAIDRCVSQCRIRRDLAESRQRLETTNAELRGTVKVLEQDQQAGRQVQMRMLPSSPLIVEDYVFSHTVIPSLYLSGDFTDYITVGDHSVTFFIADVSGHGSSSAFCTVLLKNLFARKRSDYIRKTDDTILSPAGMLKRANYELLDVGVGKFATMVVGNLDFKNNTLRYSVAGHLPQPVLVTEGGARYLRGEGSAVGLMEDAHFEEHLIDLPDSFILSLFSDGILEILPPTNLIEKEKYFLDVFRHSSEGPEAVMDMLGLDKVDVAPDDIAALFILKRGSA